MSSCHNQQEITILFYDIILRLAARNSSQINDSFSKVSRRNSLILIMLKPTSVFGTCSQISKPMMLNKPIWKANSFNYLRIIFQLPLLDEASFMQFQPKLYLLQLQSNDLVIKEVNKSNLVIIFFQDKIISSMC